MANICKRRSIIEDYRQDLQSYQTGIQFVLKDSDCEAQLIYVTKCKDSADICHSKCRKYYLLHIMLLFATAFFGGIAGIMSALVNYQAGIAIGALSALCCVVDYATKAAQKTELYGNLNLEFEILAGTMRDDVKYDLLVKRAHIQALSTELI